MPKYDSIDDHLRTSVPGIWALGDCNGRGAFTHTAYNDFEIVATNLLDNDPRRVSDRYNLYTDPALGRVGMTEAEVRKSGKKVPIAKMAKEDVSRAFEKGETQGFIKIWVDAQTKQFLGASILGVVGDEVVHSILDLMYAKAPYGDAARCPYASHRVRAVAHHVGRSQAARVMGEHHGRNFDCRSTTDDGGNGSGLKGTRRLAARVGDRAHRFPHGGRSVRHPGDSALARAALSGNARRHGLRCQCQHHGHGRLGSRRRSILQAHRPPLGHYYQLCHNSTHVRTAHGHTRAAPLHP